MLWHSQHASTRDVDSARRFDTDLSDAVERVGARRDLRSRWLNDAAHSVLAGGSQLRRLRGRLRTDALVVRTPSPEVIFVMKLYRADPQDREDLVNLWPLCSLRESGGSTGRVSPTRIRTHLRTSTSATTSPTSLTTRAVSSGTPASKVRPCQTLSCRSDTPVRFSWPSRSEPDGSIAAAKRRPRHADLVESRAMCAHRRRPMEEIRAVLVDGLHTPGLIRGARHGFSPTE